MGSQNLAGQQVSGLSDVTLALPERLGSSFSSVLLVAEQQAWESSLAQALALRGAQRPAMGGMTGTGRNTENSTKM